MLVFSHNLEDVQAIYSIEKNYNLILQFRHQFKNNHIDIRQFKKGNMDCYVTQ